MARGARLPFTVSPRGGVPLTDEDRPEEALHTVIAVSLVPGSTMHPWDLRDGLSAPGAVYRSAVDNGALAGFIERRFRLLEGRAELLAAPRITAPDGSGRRAVSVSFDNLETGEPQSMEGTV